MKFSQYLSEGIRAQDFERAVSQIVSYLSKHIGRLYRYNEIEQFTGSAGSGFGLRYFLEDGRSIRFNWKQSSASSALESITIWTGKTKDPNFTISGQDSALGELSLAKALPTIVKIIQHPSVGSFPVNERVDMQYDDPILTELAKIVMREDAFDDVMRAITQGPVSRYNISKMGRAQERVFADITSRYSDLFNVQTDAGGRQRFTFNGSADSIDRNEVMANAGGKPRQAAGFYVQVQTAGPEDTVTDGERVAAKRFANAPSRIPFEEQLEDLETIVGAVARGASNFAIVLGAGGLGKTHSVEKTLSKLGLQDGDGYFKNTSSGSPAGLFKTLFMNRTGIVVLDDCDTIVNTQEGRNLLKAALDTKKKRKLVWGKTSSWLFDPNDEYEMEATLQAVEQGLEPEKFPRYFDFEGRIVMISNLDIDQIDPDGALSTRGFVLVLDPTREEVFTFMEKILPEIEVEGDLPMSSRLEVLDLIKKQEGDVNIRKLVRGLNMAASGVPNWQRIVARYC